MQKNMEVIVLWIMKEYSGTTRMMYTVWLSVIPVAGRMQRTYARPFF